jgi:hypothetical protein
MTEKFSRSQLRTIARYLAGIIQNVAKPAQLERLAQAKVLDQMRKISPDVAKTVDAELTKARSDPYEQQMLTQAYFLSLDSALQRVFGDSQDAEVLAELRKCLGLAN